jgi:hypothetical protein
MLGRFLDGLLGDAHQADASASRAASDMAIFVPGRLVETTAPTARRPDTGVTGDAEDIAFRPGSTGVGHQFREAWPHGMFRFPFASSEETA